MTNKFDPDYAVPPGETILENMKYHKISKGDLADNMGITVARLDKLIQGNARMTEKLADKLEEELNISAILWLNLEKNYRKALAKKAKKEA